MRGSVTAAHLLLLPTREDHGHCTKAYQTTEGVPKQRSQAKSRRREGTPRLQVSIWGETNGGEGSPPRRHSNALMCLFSNPHGLLRYVVLSPQSATLGEFSNRQITREEFDRGRVSTEGKPGTVAGLSFLEPSTPASSPRPTAKSR